MAKRMEHSLNEKHQITNTKYQISSNDQNSNLEGSSHSNIEH